MMFNHLDWQGRFLTNAKQGRSPIIDGCPWVTIEARPGQGFKCIGVHKLTDDENANKCNLFMTVLGEDEQRVQGVRIAWGWAGQSPEQHKPPVLLDKPPSEPQGNLDLWPRQITWVAVDPETSSDKVTGLLMSGDWRTAHNENLHGSYFVVFQHASGIPGTPPPPVEQPPSPPVPPWPDVPPGEGFDLALLRAKIAEAVSLYQQGNNAMVDVVQMLDAGWPPT